MKLTKGQLKRIIREEYSRLLKEEYISGEILAQAASEAMDEGVRTIGEFVNWLRANYSDAVSGLSKADIRSEASFYWKAEKRDRKPDRRMPGKRRRESFYDQPGWGRFD